MLTFQYTELHFLLQSQLYYLECRFPGKNSVLATENLEGKLLKEPMLLSCVSGLYWTETVPMVKGPGTHLAFLFPAVL